MIVATRPKQWPKNLLVLSVPLAAGEFSNASVMGEAIAAMVIFTLLSAGIYIANDLRDVDEDRAHVRKRRRPFAADEITTKGGVVMCITLILMSLMGAYYLGIKFVLICVAYLLIQTGYIFVFRAVALIDITIIASGFVIRALAGGVATDIHVSEWFILVVAFSSFFIASGKRFSDLMHHSPTLTGVPTRPSLNEYTNTYLRAVNIVAAALAIASYSLWAIIGTAQGNAWATLSILPFSLGILEFMRQVDRGETGSPESLLIGSRVLQLIAVLWIVAWILWTTAH